MNGNNGALDSVRFVSLQRSTTIKTGYQRFERPTFDYPSKHSPCRAGCPAGHDIAWALYMLAQDRPDLAFETFKQDSPFPAITGRVCYHPCEPVCNRGDYDEPLAINALERACAEWGGERRVFRPRVETTQSVGIIGAGPAGLTAAYFLRQMGHQVVVYDANETPGGALTYGIPAYRLPREVLQVEIDSLRELGVDFQCGVRVGEDVSLDQLQRTHDATIVATGLTQPRRLDAPAPEDERVSAGIEFLAAVSRGRASAIQGAVCVIGGGDVAIDVARSALRLGAQPVSIYCLESLDGMPAHPAEAAAATAEGITIHPQRAPSAIVTAGSELEAQFETVTRLDRLYDGRMQFETDGQIADRMRCQRVYYAISQQADLGFLPGVLSRRSRLETDFWGATALPGVFAAGDIIGGYNVVNAIGSAKRAAIGVDCWLRGVSTDGVRQRVAVGHEGAVAMSQYMRLRRGDYSLAPMQKVTRLRDINLDYFPPAARTELSELPVESRRAGFDEVNDTLPRERAVAEAQRCFQCGACNMCGNCFRYCPDSSVLQKRDGWGFEIDLEHCKGCGVCVEECPRDAMDMVPEWEVSDARRRRYPLQVGV